ncbi:hypothetical protein REPUB_Repub09cG0131600 [Reevesia pubescens]
MSVSTEALAMAGTDYLEWGMVIEEWEQEDLDLPPAHLFADEGEGEIVGNSIIRPSAPNFDFLSQMLAGVGYNNTESGHAYLTEELRSNCTKTSELN